MIVDCFIPAAIMIGEPKHVPRGTSNRLRTLIRSSKCEF